MTVEEYEQNLIENIIELEKKLKKKRYRTKLVKRVLIPKGEGKYRPLGIICLEDKLVQIAATRILEAIYEVDFLDCSYGYRPGRGARIAVHTVWERLMNGKYNYVLDADIKGFFDNINHDWLIKMLKQRIKDESFIELIKKWLKAGILEEGKVIRPGKGTPQGGIISPILSNIYLHYVVDLWVAKKMEKKCRGRIYICRYADDIIFAFQYVGDVMMFRRLLKQRLQKFNLELSEEKTKIIKFSRFRKKEGNRFEFLGIEYRWQTGRKGDVIKQRTSRKKLKSCIRNFNFIGFKELCRSFNLLHPQIKGYQPTPA